jgi:hypothetical protein
VIDPKLLHNASFTMVNGSDGPYSTAKYHTYDNNELLQECGCHLNQMHDGEHVKELSIAKDDRFVEAGV